MAHKLPIGFQGSLRNAWVRLAHNAVDGHGGRDAALLQRIKDSPKSNAHAVLMPRPIGQIWKKRLPHGWRQDRTWHGTLDGPMFYIDNDPNQHAIAIGQLQSGPVNNGLKRGPIAE